MVASYAVDAGTGHLVELRRCGTARPAVAVDEGDWRAYRHVTATTDGAATAFHAITPDGQLWWRRQPAAGAPLGPAVRVAPEVDWSVFTSFVASGSGFLHGLTSAGATPTYRHDGWSDGRPTVTAHPALFAHTVATRLSAVRHSAEANVDGVHVRGFRRSDGGTDIWYLSGELPEGVTGVTGSEPYLLGVDAAGGAVLLYQRRIDCVAANHHPWNVIDAWPGIFARVVRPAPQTSDTAPTVPPPNVSGRDCRLPAGPWEWQDRPGGD